MKPTEDRYNLTSVLLFHVLCVVCFDSVHFVQRTHKNVPFYTIFTPFCTAASIEWELENVLHSAWLIPNDMVKGGGNKGLQS